MVDIAWRYYINFFVDAARRRVSLVRPINAARCRVSSVRSRTKETHHPWCVLLTRLDAASPWCVMPTRRAIPRRSCLQKIFKLFLLVFSANQHVFNLFASSNRHLIHYFRPKVNGHSWVAKDFHRERSRSPWDVPEATVDFAFNTQRGVNWIETYLCIQYIGR